MSLSPRMCPLYSPRKTIEGRWHTGSGITAAECRALVLGHRHEATIQRLNDRRLWGKSITDERYLLTSRS